MKQLMLTIAALKAGEKTDDQIDNLATNACNNLLAAVGYTDKNGRDYIGVSAIQSMSVDLEAVAQEG